MQYQSRDLHHVRMLLCRVRALQAKGTDPSMFLSWQPARKAPGTKRRPKRPGLGRQGGGVSTEVFSCYSQRDEKLLEGFLAGHMASLLTKLWANQSRSLRVTREICISYSRREAKTKGIYIPKYKRPNSKFTIVQAAWFLLSSSSSRPWSCGLCWSCFHPPTPYSWAPRTHREPQGGVGQETFLQHIPLTHSTHMQISYWFSTQDTQCDLHLKYSSEDF